MPNRPKFTKKLIIYVTKTLKYLITCGLTTQKTTRLMMLYMKNCVLRIVVFVESCNTVRKIFKSMKGKELMHVEFVALVL